MKKIIKRIVDRIRFSYPIMIEESLTKILEEELPDFQRIDEERFLRIYRRNYTINIDDAIKEYNSTLPPALKPLPKDMPKEYNSLATPYQVWLQVQQEYGTPANNLQPLPKEKPKWFHYSVHTDDLWKLACLNYGTPEPKPDLPTVEELAKEMFSLKSNTMEELAKNLIDKYSLHPREWWQDCEKFMYKGRAYKKYSHEVFPDGRTVLHSQLAGHNLIYCTPYTTPSAQDIIAKHNLSEEEIKIIKQS